METRRFQYMAERVSALGALPDCMPIAAGLELKKFEPGDASALFEILERNPEVKETVAWAAKVDAAEDVEPRMRNLSNEVYDGRFVIINGGRLIGYVGAHPGQQDHEFGVSYMLDKTARGKGYVSQALNILVEALETHVYARHIYSQIIIGNESSEAVALRLGFQPAETLIGVDFPVEQQRWRLELDKGQ